MKTDDIKPETPKPKVPPSVHDDDEPHIPAPKKTPPFGDKHLMNTDDIKPETPKPKVPPSVHESVSLTPRPPPPPITETSTPARIPVGTRGQIPSTPSIRETKADAWERNELEKIKERYEKLLETIESWEKRKKMKARRKLNKRELSESEGKRVKARKKYMNKINYIDEIAGGARAQADERRKNEVLKAREKANIIRTTGKLPGLCSCF
ncbi:remorin-like [Gastrolobium bilobum]|uniref:remorin-like n=1 Tax=Gastrolobium bilobum TaxID=150636 RepID=UPI002AB0B975|nr:remorin-like [Gastrolobium bilobum]